MADYEDPRWGRAIRGVGWFVIPIAHLWTARGKPPEDGLTSLRRVYFGLVDSLFFFLVAFAFVAPWNSGGPGLTPVVVALSGVVCLLAITLLRCRPLVGDTQERLAVNYRASFFIGIGYAAIPALSGLYGTLIAQSLWIYLVGLPFSLVGFALIAPTKADIERRQQEIQSPGSPLSLGQALLDQRGNSASSLGQRFDLKTFRIPPRFRYAIYLIALAAILIATAIHAVRSSFNPDIVMIPAIGLLIFIPVSGVLSSSARIIDHLRHRRRPPPAVGTE
jgi:hypothetical protein